MTKSAPTTAATNPFAAFTAQSFSPEAMMKSFSGFEGVASEAQQNIEAVTNSVTIAAKGAEALRNEGLAYSKSSFESIVAQAAALKGARSPQEALELQVAFGQASLETFLKQVNVTSELFAAAIRESARPINERATSAAAKIQPQA